MSVTIQEVAEAAGVSKATVSKVLHKSYSISQETCDRVNAVIKELGYQPNRRAQSFATGATKTILFLAEMQHGVGFDNPHLFEIMAGVENALSEKGYGLIVQHSTALDLWQHFDELLQGSYVDGVILHASVVSKDVALCLAHTELPYIVVGAPDFSNQLCWIDTNNSVAGQIAVTHLWRNGYDRIAFIGGPKEDDFVEDTVCLQQVQSAEDFYQSAVAFGNFQHQLADYPAHTLHETIPHFHDTPKRFADFQRAVAEDRMGRAAQVQREIEFVRAREADYHIMVDLLAAGKLPLRVTHNDTKLNNILFDKTTGEGLCVIDLDTVMPGLAANDFGDSIRFGANHCAEDEADLSKVNFSMELFEIYTKGFLQAAGDAFTPLEKQTLPWGAKLMTMECGMRFLADYLEGDHYFHINYETQNLNRARTQFKLTADMERNWDAMQKVIEKYC